MLKLLIKIPTLVNKITSVLSNESVKMLTIQIPDYVRKQLTIATILYVGNIVVGYGVGWSSPVVVKLQDLDQSPLPEVISTETSSWVGSIFLLGIFLGPNITGSLSNIIGRKWCMILGGCINIAALIILALSSNLAMVLTGRLVSGIGSVMILITNVVYIGEIASTNLRGVILTGTGVMHALGILLVYLVGPNVQYSVVSYVLLAMGAFHVFGALCLPESPVFYLLKGNEEAAKNSLRELGRGKDVEKEIKSISENTKEFEDKKASVKELFTVKSNRISLLLTSVLFILQLGNGTTASLFFAETIFRAAGASVDSYLSTIIVGLTQLVGALTVPLLIEKAGRKTLTLISLAGCSVGMALLGTYFYLDEDTADGLGWLPLVAFVLSVFCYSIGLNITPNTFTGEMFKANVRSVGSAFAISIGSLSGLLTVTTYGYLITAVGEAITFWIYTVINVLGFVFTVILVPETKGMTLAEIEKMLSK